MVRPGARDPKSTSVGAKILVVEDDTDTRDAIAQALGREGLEVLATDEGRKALELMEAWRPALVLLDLHMAGMDGRAFRAEQKRRGRLSRIPVVLMTGDPEPAVDADVVLTKPFSTADLLAVVARFVPGLRGGSGRAAPSA